MNLPNKLTVLRVGLTFAMAAFLTADFIPYAMTVALLLFAFAGLTDYWDGRLARRTHCISAFGQLMDPLADKILICAAFVSFVAIGHIMPAWIVILIISREFMVTGLRLLGTRAGRVLPAGRWGKHKMIWQTVAVVVILCGLVLREDLLPLYMTPAEWAGVRPVFDRWFHGVTHTMGVIVAALTVISGGIYLWQSRELFVNDL